MFRHDSFIFIGPAAWIVGAGLRSAREAGESTHVNFTVTARGITEQDVSDFTLLAAKNPGMTLTICNESFRVDETDQDKQLTTIFEDGAPVAEIGLSMEDTATEGTKEAKLLEMIRSIAERFNITIKDTVADASISVENLHDVIVENIVAERTRVLPSGATIMVLKNSGGETGYYLARDIGTFERDQAFIEDLRANRQNYPSLMTFVVDNYSDSPEVIPAGFSELADVPGVRTYLVKPGTVSTSLESPYAQTKVKWKVRVPSLRRV